jgi:hypothetical protein
MYVPNTIRIPTHGVDLWHHGLQIGERNQKSPIEPPQGEESRRKKESEEEERKRGGRKRKKARGLLAGQSR